MSVMLTDHARARLQQRGIPEDVIDGLLEFGRKIHDHRGSEIVFFDHHARDRLRRTYGDVAYKRIESKLSAYAVVGQDGSVITVGHRTKRINRH